MVPLISLTFQTWTRATRYVLQQILLFSTAEPCIACTVSCHPQMRYAMFLFSLSTKSLLRCGMSHAPVVRRASLC